MFNAPFSRVFRPAFGPGLAAAAPSGPTTLILDNFTDADATALASHAIAPTNTPATSWTAVTGTWTIQSNRAVMSGAISGARLATCNPGVADCTLSATVQIRCSSSGGVRDGGFNCRYSNTNNFWRVGGNDNVYPNVIRIVERNGGSETIRASTNTTNTYLLGPIAMVAVLSGSTITLSTDGGAYTISYASATLNQTTTSHGLMMEGKSGQTYYHDDFQVTVP